MDADKQGTRSRREDEEEVLEQGREGTGKGPEQRLPQEAHRQGAVLPLRQSKVDHRSEEQMGLRGKEQFMNSEGPSACRREKRSLDECFANKPHVRERLLEIAEMIDKLVAEGCTAHEAEARAMEEIRKLGNGILTEWASQSEKAAAAKACASNPQIQPYRKKKP